MGGFFLSFKKDSSKAKESFLNRGFRKSFEIETKTFFLEKYHKKTLEHDPYVFESGDDFIVGQGTISYFSKSPSEGFYSLARDFLNNNPRLEEIRGHFTIITHINGRLTFFIDGLGIGAPYHIGNEFYSSSFLSCCDELDALSVNEEAAWRQIVSGLIIPPETIFQEISRASPGEVSDIFQFIKPKNPFSGSQNNLSPKEVSKFIRKELERWKPYHEEFGVDLGISGGYDSRLLLSAFLKGDLQKIQIHTNWKKHPDRDSKISKAISQELKKELRSIPIKQTKDLNGDDLKSLLKSAMNFYDGQFPVNHGWTRFYRTEDHRTETLGKMKFGLSGIGGEIFRNDSHFLPKYIRKSYLFKYFFSAPFRSSLFSKKEEKNLVKSFWGSGDKLISTRKKEEKIGNNELRKFLFFGLEPFGPGIRNYVENQVSFFYSPFQEFSFVDFILNSKLKIGMGGKLQARLIFELNPDLAAIESDYGFPFTRYPFKNKLKDLFSGILGQKFLRWYSRKKLVSKFDYLETFGANKDLIEGIWSYGYRNGFPEIDEINGFSNDFLDRYTAFSFILFDLNHKISSQ